MAWIIFLICLALFFDYLNGFHDAANAVSTVISTRVLSPRLAVWWAAFFNFVAFLIFKTAVAKTIGAGIVDIDVVDSNLVFGALIGVGGVDVIGGVGHKLYLTLITVLAHGRGAHLVHSPDLGRGVERMHDEFQAYRR